MSATGNDQYWQSLRPLRKVGKLRGIIDLPVFSAECGEPKGCIRITNDDQAITTDNDGTPTAWPDYPNTFTIECWVKADYFQGAEGSNVPGNPTKTILSVEHIGTTGRQYAILCDCNGQVLVDYTTIINDEDSLRFTGYRLSVDTWTHIAVVYNTVTTSIKTYINGILVDTYTNANVSTLVSNNGFMYIGKDIAGTYPSWRGYIDEIRLWNAARSADDILRCYRSPRDKSGSVDTTLTRYIKFDVYPFIDQINGYVYSSLTAPDESVFVDDDGYPFRYGSSFIAGQFPLDTNRAFSFKYPVTPPTNCNFVPVVSWEDAAGLVHRYKLWELDGFIYNPNFPLYTGQKILETEAFIEIWNIDGNHTVDNTSIIELETSILSIVTNPNSVTPDTNATLTIDTALAEPIPLTNFPLEFNTQQTY